MPLGPQQHTWRVMKTCSKVDVSFRVAREPIYLCLQCGLEEVIYFLIRLLCRLMQQNKIQSMGQTASVAVWTNRNSCSKTCASVSPLLISVLPEPSFLRPRREIRSQQDLFPCLPMALISPLYPSSLWLTLVLSPSTS